jgi:NADH-quinone oxidoreductase subunit N
LFFQNTLHFFLNNSNYGISIIYFNILIYISLLYLFFSLLFLFDVKKIKTLNNLKVFNGINFISVTTVLVFLSMSGIPPLAGFVGKFLLFNFLFFMQKYLIIVLFSLLNFFSIYFYLQNLRFLISKAQPNNFILGGFYVFFNKGLLNLIVFLNLFNFLNIFYFEDILYFFLNVFFLKLF